MTKNILITGGAGFIGSHVLDILSGSEEYKVTVLDNLTSGVKENVPKNVELIVDDIRSKTILDIFKSHNFDTVIHLAAQTMVPFSIDHPAIDADLNIMGLINVLEAAKATGVKNVVFSSSAAVYGDNPNLPLKESEKLNPTSFYGLTKMMTEDYLKLYNKLFAINATVLRFANVYGERQGSGGEGGVICIFGRQLAKNESLVIYGDGKQTRDFVYVKDIAKAIVKSIDLQGFNTINVSTATEVSINDLANMFIAVSHTNATVEHLEARTGDIYRSSLDNSELKKKLGIVDFYPLEEGLSNTYKFFASK